MSIDSIPELREYAGMRIYIKKRQSVDWDDTAKRWKEGKTQADLARELGISRRTVNKHLRSRK